ncbi:MAG: ATP-binding protein, partial [Chloroflexi bacterium]|nr:ATP-binding protein [Chloroflexota bacterium]
MLSARDAWQATMGQLQVQLNRTTFDTWLRGAELLAYEDGEFVVRVRNAFAKDWIEEHLAHLVTQALEKVFKRSVQIRYVVNVPSHLESNLPSPGALWEAQRRKYANKNGTSAPAAVDNPANTAPQEERAADGTTASETATEQPIDYSEWDPRVTDIKFGRHTNRPQSSTELDQRYTFDTFVTGPCNQFAQAAALAVAETPGETYNPLVLYGGTGLGKTHLLHAIGQACQAQGKRVLYVAAEAFTNELVAAIRARKTDAFRTRYREVDVLLVDDIQFIEGKTSTEEEFYHTFTAL